MHLQSYWTRAEGQHLWTKACRTKVSVNSRRLIFVNSTCGTRFSLAAFFIFLCSNSFFNLLIPPRCSFLTIARHSKPFSPTIFSSWWNDCWSEQRSILKGINKLSEVSWYIGYKLLSYFPVLQSLCLFSQVTNTLLDFLFGQSFENRKKHTTRSVVLNLWGIRLWWEMAELTSGEWPVEQMNTASNCCIFTALHVDLQYFTNHNHLENVLITKTTNIWKISEVLLVF